VSKGQRLLSYPQLKTEKGIGWSRQWLGVQIAAGNFPKPIALGAMTRGFVEAEVDDWIAARMRDRDSAA
jgi:predicted DNA-binding transcriptional regulator AlpA